MGFKLLIGSLLLFLTGLGLFVFLLEALDAAFRIHQLLLSSEHGVALGTDFDVQAF